jgi:hypothetical protein
MATKFISLLLLLLDPGPEFGSGIRLPRSEIRDLGSGMDKNQDLGLTSRIRNTAVRPS